MRPGAGCGCWSASRSGRRRPRPRINAAFRRRSPNGGRRRRNSSRRRPDSGIGCATSCSAIGFQLAAFAALADADWTVGDLGCGTGQVSAALAPFVARVVAVDASAAMLQAAKKRLHGFDNIDLRRGELEALPIDDARLDAATLMLVLHHVPEPARALAEVARVLKPEGRVIIADMLPHDRDNYRQQMGHVWLGFSGEHITAMLRESGFEQVRVVSLPPDPKAKGPGLFIATGQKTGSRRLRAPARRWTPGLKPGLSRRVLLDRRGEKRWRLLLKSFIRLPRRKPPAASRSKSRICRSPSSAARKSASPSRKCPG